MIKLFKRIFKNEHGQIVVLFPILFIILCGFIGLAVDTSWIVYNKHKLQNSTDLAAFSGAQSLPSNTSEASSETLKYLQQNYEKSIGANINFSNNDHRMDVDCEDNINLFFSRLFGIQTATIKATSGVQVGAVAKPGNIVPLGIDHLVLSDPNFSYDEEITLYNSVKTKGNFGLLDPTGGGGGITEIVNYIVDEYKGDIPLAGAESINTETGYTPKHICDALKTRWDNGNTIIICPLIDWEKATGSSEPVLVKGYAAFEISQEPTLKGNDLEIIGKFVNYIDPDGLPGDVPDYGLTSISLVN